MILIMAERIRLKCDRCSRNLSGSNNSKVFFCLQCERALDISKGEPRFYKLKFAVPLRKRDLPMEYFPFWLLKSEYSIENTEDGSELTGMHDFIIPSFFIKNINYFGDIGLYYKLKDIKPEYGERKDIPVFPADRGLEDANKYPYIYLMKERSQKIRSQSLNIHVREIGVELILVPFYRTDHSYFDSFLSWKYPSGALI